MCEAHNFIQTSAIKVSRSRCDHCYRSLVPGQPVVMTLLLQLLLIASARYGIAARCSCHRGTMPLLSLPLSLPERQCSGAGQRSRACQVHSALLPLSGCRVFMITTPDRVTLAPTNCSGVNASPKRRYPAKVANTGVRKVKLDSLVRLPLEALLKNIAYAAALPSKLVYTSAVTSPARWGQQCSG